MDDNRATDRQSPGMENQETVKVPATFTDAIACVTAGWRTEDIEEARSVARSAIRRGGSDCEAVFQCFGAMAADIKRKRGE